MKQGKPDAFLDALSLSCLIGAVISILLAVYGGIRIIQEWLN